MFLSHMIVHHEQALELTALVPSRTQRAKFIRFARYVDGAQRVEIDQMKSLLDLAPGAGWRFLATTCTVTRRWPGCCPKPR